jgi:hypothetical protein
MRKKPVIDPKKIFNGNVEITKETSGEWEEKLKGIHHITGNLYIYSNASLKADSLKSVGGYLSLHSNVGEKLEKQLWKHNPRNEWIVNDTCSDWLLSREGKFKYHINGVVFPKTLFDAVRKDNLTAQKVFAIQNMEQRRVAYEKMDKIKMRDLPNLKMLDEAIDAYSNPMRIISFGIAGFTKPFKYLHCVCPSSGREYYLETKQDKCEAAKAKSFGLDAIEFTEEW